MKKIRILSGLMAVVMLLSLMAVNVFAADSGKVVLSDVPFDYMTNMQTRSFDSYENLSTPNKKLVYSIPDGVAKTLTTEALLETILNNKYIVDLFAYDSFEYAVTLKESQFKILEFLDREDSNEVLSSYIEKYQNLLAEKELKYNLYLKDITSLEVVSNLPNDYSHIILQIELMKQMQGIISPKISENNIIQRASNDCYITTKGGRAVAARENQTWTQLLIPEFMAQIVENDYIEEYPNNIEVSGISPVYNCHSYAWHSQNINTNKFWVFNADLYYAEATSATQNPQVGTKVCYFNYYTENGSTVNKLDHSALVYSLKSNGDVNKVISKWGHCGLFIHSIEDSPYWNAETNLTSLAYRNY